MAHYKGAAAEANRAMNIQKKREKAREELEIKKRKMEEDLKLDIDTKFVSHNNEEDTNLRNTTIGLVTLDQMKAKQELASKEREKMIALEGDSMSASRKKFKVDIQASDDDSSASDDDEKKITSSKKVAPKVKRKIQLDELDIDASYLPDRERDEEERKLREKLAVEWREQQEKLKEERIEVTYSYWDGSGHRKTVVMKKGHTIFHFLQKCLDQLRKDFNELRAVCADHLMYVKEDLIIPHHYTFYDFIVTKARGKSGPLFSFDVHDDVRLIADATVEKDESHAGKVLLRSWYERNKHIFPASRWEPYNPNASYNKYTVSDKRATK